MFDLRGTEPQNQLVREALAACDFPFDQLRPSLTAEGKSTVTVEWADLSRYSSRATMAHDDDHSHIVDTHGEEAHTVERDIDGRRAVLGLFYLPPHTRIVLDASLVQRPALAREVLLAEAAHLVDYHGMTAEHRRQVVNALHVQDLPAGADTSDGAAFTLDGHVCSWFDVGPYRMWCGETFMEAFIEAFAPSVPVTIELGHPTGPQAAAAVRRVLLGEGRVFTGPSEVFHDSHQGITPRRWFDRDEALRAGLRPCRVCRP